MPKLRSHKGLAKRIKVTATGKVKRKHCGSSHLMSGKNAKRRRRIGSSVTITGVVARTIKSQLSK
jgi:large subunit ribosomal protein L35